uniref:Uncharacterized protein n=5 Tax=Pseudocrenilabrinae TaxID=318546 RepID=A0A3Q4GH34_NEOBR
MPYLLLWPGLPRLCKSEPTSLGRHSCSSSLPNHHQACTPSPCRGSGHLGMQKRATLLCPIIPERPMNYWQRP